MTTPIIIVENLGKSFRIGRATTHGPMSLREALATQASKLFRKRSADDRPDSPDEEFWALRDVSFAVEPGQIVGIIGRNGAGKSTLLKVMSRITEPTTGRIRLRGRVASLLEVGTGFHPELTGRENIFLNGAILGMTRREIRSKFDEIAAFSEVEKFLDTPVKRYSSGMYVRLAFAVAAHLEPEILVIDEVLAVGDADFQKKCLGKMRTMHTEGRTVLVVSHQMSMINALCDRGIVLKRGQIVFDGTTSDAVMHYLSQGGVGGSAQLDADEEGRVIGNSYARLHKAWLTRADDTPANAFDLDEPIKVWMEYTVLQAGLRQTYPNFHFFDELGSYLFVSSGVTPRDIERINRPGRWICHCTVPPRLLNTGTFTVGVAVTSLNPGIDVAFFERGALMFQVTEDMSVTLDTTRVGYAGPMPGTIRPQLDWTVEQIGAAADVR